MTEQVHEQMTEQDGPWYYTFGLLFGGLVLAFGLKSLYWSFGWADHECLNCDLSAVGSHGVDNLSLLPAADYSIGMIVCGALMMIVLNAFAWYRTSGY